MREAMKRLRWRVRPGSFVPVECGIVPLADLARAVETPGELAAGTDPVAYAELAPGGTVDLAPLFVLGAAAGDAPHGAARPVPPVRLYRFQGETRVFGKGLFLRDGALVHLPVLEFCELGRLDYPAHAMSLERDGDRALARLPAGLRRIDEPCLYLAQGGEGVWGHWLVDLFPRLVLGLAVPARMRVVIDADAPPFADELLARAGIAPERVLRHDKFRTTLVLSDMIVPSFPRYGDAFSPLVDLAWGLLPGSDAASRRKLYVSRARTGSTIADAPAIEAMAKARGYRIVHAERLDLAAKARLFAEASHVVGEFGSGLHNTVFARAGTRVAVLQSAASGSYVQSGIGARRGQPTGIVYGPSTDGGRRFEMPPARFAEALDRLED